MREAHNNYVLKHCIDPKADSGGSPVNGSGIDRLGFEEAIFIFSLGAVTGSPTDLDSVWKIQESDDNSTFTDVPGLSQTKDETGDVQKSYDFYVDLQGRKRYIRITVTNTFTGGTSPTVGIGATALLFEKKFNA